MGSELEINDAEGAAGAPGGAGASACNPSAESACQRRPHAPGGGRRYHVAARGVAKDFTLACFSAAGSGGAAQPG